MAEERLTQSLSESLLTLLGFDEIYGAQALTLVTPELFEPPLDDIAARIIQFRERFRKPPGLEHIDDIFDSVLSKGSDRRAATYKSILQSMARQAPGLNSEYIYSRIRDFVRLQKLKNSIHQAGERYLAGGDNQVEDIERIMFDALKETTQAFDVGTYLDDSTRALRYLDQTNASDACTIGIPALDARRLVPTKKEMYLLIAPRKAGKTFFCVHCGKMALLRQRWNVVHVTLEVSEEIVAQRYHQSLLSIAKRNAPSPAPVFERNKDGKFYPSKIEYVYPKLTFNDPDKVRAAVIKELGTRVYKLRDYDQSGNGKGKSISLGQRFHNLVIKYFPSGQLTIRGLENYLDALERLEGFIPDMVIVDYPQLMDINADAYRVSLGQIGVKLRGLAGQRNFALVVVAQGSRLSERTSLTQSYHIAEDISLVATADNVLTLTRGPFEKLSGTARLFVSNARNEEDGFQVCITQRYATAQFALESYNMGMVVDTYLDDLQGLVGNSPAEGQDDTRMDEAAN